MIDPKILASLQHSDIIPVIAPIGIGPDGATYNINADTVAGAIAAAAGAARLLMLTDVIGVLDKNGELIPEPNTASIEALRAAGTISGGMIPKLDTCIRAGREGLAARSKER